MINANLYGIFNSMNWREQDINQGLQIGKKLLRTLKIRNEQVTLDSHRLKKGKIDPRRIFAAEYVDDIFKNQHRAFSR